MQLLDCSRASVLAASSPAPIPTQPNRNVGLPMQCNEHIANQHSWKPTESKLKLEASLAICTAMRTGNYPFDDIISFIEQMSSACLCLWLLRANPQSSSRPRSDSFAEDDCFAPPKCVLMVGFS